MEEIITIEKKEKKKKAPFIAGLIVLCLAVVGLVNIIGAVAEKVAPANDETKEYEEYSSFLTWVVGVDPTPFSDVTKADKNELLNIALCTLLQNDKTTASYEVTERGLKVPKADVEKQYVQMYGAETPIVHANVVGYGYEFTYDVGNEIYYVPITGVSPVFATRIESVKKTGGIIELRVGYIGVSSVEVAPNGELKPASPDKYAAITLKKTDKGFNLISLITETVGERQE